MQEVLALALQSMQQDMQRLDRTGMNLANALTPGYQREVAAARPLRLGQPSFAALVGASSVEDLPAQGPRSVLGTGLLVQTDQRPGTLRSTGQSLDVALAGPGYFEVNTPDGPAYTRQGQFRLDGQGRLVTAQGHPVMGRGAEIYLPSGQLRIDAQGNIFDARSMAGGGRNDRPVAQLKVVEAGPPWQPRRLGDGLMALDGQPAQLADADIRIQQGFLENSNVSSMHEMVQLMQTMRHFESMQKVALGYDEMTGQAIRKLGEIQ